MTGTGLLDVVIHRSQLELVFPHAPFPAEGKPQKSIDATPRLALNLRRTPPWPHPPRILIVTAAFGEGHNSAARNLALALDAAGAVTRVSDPCLLGAPRLTAVVSRGYRFVTTHFPQIWARIYRSTDRCDFSQQRSPRHAPCRSARWRI